MLVIAVSPYHLTTREPAAMASLLLADHAVTMIPAPAAGRVGSSVSRGAFMAEAGRNAAYRDFMDSWSWAGPLFDEQVLGSVWEGQDAADDVRAVCDRIEREPGLGELRGLIGQKTYEDDQAYLAAVARDLLRAGPDPAISVPVAAGLDSFASRNGLLVARAAGRSVAQRAEDRLGEVLCRIAIPALTQASGERVLLARTLLREALERLRDALEDLVLDGSARGDGNGKPDRAGEARDAARAYADAFEAERHDLLSPPGPNDPEEVHVIEETVTVCVQRLPADAVLRSTLSALRTMHGSRPANGSAGPSWAEGSTVALVVKRLGKATRA